MPDDLASLGRQAGTHMFTVFEKLFEADGNSPASVKYDLFDAWYKLQLLDCEIRMHGAGVAGDQVKIWQDACVGEMQRRLDNLRKQMARPH